MSISPFAFDPVNGWADQTAFPTYLDDEPTIRAKYQLLHSQTRDWINNTLVPAVDAKAPLASPVFTGTPKAPTPTTGDNSTKIATTAFVNSAVDYAKTLVIPNDATAQTAWEAADDGIAHGQTVLWAKTDGNNVYILRLAQKKYSTSWEQIGGVTYKVLDETYNFSQLYVKAEHSISVMRSTHTYDGSYTYSASWLGVTNLQAALTFDNAPTSGSNNPVKSGGVYTAINNVKTVAIDRSGSAGTAYTAAAAAYDAGLAVLLKDGNDLIPVTVVKDTDRYYFVGPYMNGTVVGLRRDDVRDPGGGFPYQWGNTLYTPIT